MVEPILVFQVACMVAFAMAVTGGIVTIFSSDENRQSGAVGAGIVSVATTMLILFMYLELRSRKNQHITHSKPPNTY
jgi:hypothetical protein